MECRVCTEALTAFIDKELSSEESAVVERHIDACTACKDEYDSLLTSYELTSQMPQLEVSPLLWANIASEISSEQSPNWWKRFVLDGLFGRPWVPATAALGAALVALLLVVIPPSPPPAETAFSDFVQQRELLSKRNEGILFRAEGFDRNESRRNPFIKQVQYTGRNPFRSGR
jgi:anti-sigma factor RsiW